MFALISDILTATRSLNLNLQTLQGVELLSKECMAGNNVVVAKVRIEGRNYAMRCYRRSKPYLRELYNEAYYPNELNIGGVLSPRYIDIVLCEWFDGRSLSMVVNEAVKSGDAQRLGELAKAFDRLAINVIDAEWAHGDLTPDNIIVSDDGTLHLVDLDARYIPELEGCKSCELGTQAYQTTRRGENDFHSRIDDFSIAIISTSLHALAIDPTLKSQFPFLDGVLFDGQKVGDDEYEVVDELLSIFAQSGDFVHYRMLKWLRLNQLVIDALPDLLQEPKITDNDLELFINWGICGYCDAASGEIVIPPLFDEAFEFRGDHALVRVSYWWFYIDKSGCAVESCGEWQSGKPPKERMIG